jgi:hypothetical protein
MAIRIPKALTKKRAALGFRRQELIKALKNVDRAAPHASLDEHL